MSAPLTSERAIRRARTLIELMMNEMHASLRDPNHLTPEQWDKFFGAKQSMIANLHKLVATLAALPEPNAKYEVMEENVAINAQEMAMLTSWLAQEQH